MIEVRDLLDGVIRPVLSYLGPRYAGPHAERLLLGTAAVESGLGSDLIQDAPGGFHGPALSPWQMEPATADDLFANFLRFRPELLDAVTDLKGDFPRGWGQPLTGNLYYACAMARVHYFRVRAPHPTDLPGYARYWKAHYNTPLGKGTEAKFIEAYRAMVAPHLGD